MKLLATLGALLFSGIIAAAPLHDIVVFGDSLSDTGNLYDYMKHQLPQCPPYYQGRFSNGPVWVEHLISSYFPANPSDHLLNYAIGGAGVTLDDNDDAFFTLKKEVDGYLISHQGKASPDSLYIVWIGANNYMGLPSDPEQAVKEVNEGISRDLQRLVEKGAKNILVISTPDLGKSPAAIVFDYVDLMHYFSTLHNATLAQSVKDLKQKNPDVNWLFFDMSATLDKVLEHPADYGFTNITDMCVTLLEEDSAKKSILSMVANVRPKAGLDACDGYLFFDIVHPTGPAHKLMADKMRQFLDESGVTFSE